MTNGLQVKLGVIPMQDDSLRSGGKRYTQGRFFVAPALVLLTVALALLLSSGTACEQRTAVSSSEHEETIDFSAPLGPEEQEAADDLAYYLDQVLAEAWVEAYKMLAHDLQSEVSESEYVESQGADLGTRLVDYDIVGVRVDAENPRKALAKVRLWISDGKTTETWVELWSLTYSGGDWRLSTTPRL
ncbi:MAG: hypothetical protein Kow00129_17280 [Thermoleophilia bacterium]